MSVAIVSQASDIVTETVILDRDGDRAFETYVARPAQGRGLGVLILTEMWGVTPAKLELANDYAQRGFCAIVPNIFWRSTPSGVVGDEGPERDIAWDRLRAFDFDAAGNDLHKAVAFLRNDRACSGKVAAIGFCMGGRLAFLAASRAKADGAIALYALGVALHGDEMKNVKGPVQLHYGLADKHIPLTEIEQVVKSAAPFGNITIFTYPGVGHGFFNPMRAAYDAKAVALAEERIDQLFAELSSNVEVG